MLLKYFILRSQILSSNHILFCFSNVIDVTTVEPHSLEKGEFLERAKQYQ